MANSLPVTFPQFAGHPKRAYRFAVRVILSFFMLCSLLSASPSLALDHPQDAGLPVAGVATSLAERPSTLDLLLERAISQQLIAGGVVVVGNHEGILATAARGQLNASAGSPQLTDRTVFDLASLTKVVATAPAVMKLLDKGLVNLSDPLSRFFPEFAQAGHGDITVLNLLTHTSGLEDITLGAGDSIENAVKKAAAQNYRSFTGSRFHYADINFILLGEMVRRVSGETLDAFCREEIYAPLGTRETLFLPPPELSADVATTSGFSKGVVQDPNARRLGGVAGHAGLFSSAYDLSRYARLMLGGGVLDDRRILSQQVVSRMTTPYLCNGGQVRRGLGWDIASPFSAPKGSLFSEASYGHTGYSGSSIWIDPQQDLFVILLTRRLDYRDVRDFNQLRRDVSTIAAADFIPGAAGRSNPSPEVEKISAKLLQPVVLAALQLAPRGGAHLRGMSERRARFKGRSDGSRRQVARARGQRLAHLARVDRSDKSCRAGQHRSKKRRVLARS